MAPSIFAQFASPPFLFLLIYCCFLQYQIYQQRVAPPSSEHLAHLATSPVSANANAASVAAAPSTSQPSAHSSPEARSIAWKVANTVSPPPRAPAKLSQEAEKLIRREQYGGKNDPVHLGGFTVQDNNTISYNLWNYMMSEWSVKSFIDVGCGKGFSSRYFYDRGVKVTCVEGSSDAVQQSLLPRSHIVQHDFSLGPWWPSETFDIAWSTEFVEHVGRAYMSHYLPVFHKAALIMITSSGWGGWHHVEVHAPWWWRARMQAQGFVFSPELTQKVSEQIAAERSATGKWAQQLGGMQVFINPAVAALPQHHHLIGGHGCYGEVIDNADGGVPCEGADALPARYQSVLQCTKNGRDLDNSLWQCKKNPAAALKR